MQLRDTFRCRSFTAEGPTERRKGLLGAARMSDMRT
jgi:hypothetical protein